MFAFVYELAPGPVFLRVAATLPGPDAVTSPVRAVMKLPEACFPLKVFQSVFVRHPELLVSAFRHVTFPAE